MILRTLEKNLSKLHSQFQNINNQSSSNEKIKFIKRNADDSLFVETLKFVYDDFIRTGMSYKTLSEISQNGMTITDYQGEYDLVSLMDYVKKHNTGTLSTVELIQDFASMFDDDLRDFIYRIFGKELKIGVTAKSINKALGKGFIREFSVQLAHPYHKYADKVTGKEFVLTQKLDGHRAIFISDGNTGQFYTRKGLLIKGLDVLTQQAEYLAEQIGNYGSIPYVLDGELLLKNESKLETKDLFRATSRILRSDNADKSNIQFNIFDALPAEEFYDGISKDGFNIRKDFLSMAIDSLKYESPKALDHINLVRNLYEGSDISMIVKLQHDYVEKQGWEGLMLNLSDGHYVTKRTNELLKIKEFFNADVLVKDVFEGTGKLKGMLGGIIVDYKGYNINVGSGFSEQERRQYWDNPEEIVGRVVDISYFEETHNQNNDDISLRFPTFNTVRTDKTKEDVSYEV